MSLTWCSICGKSQPGPHKPDCPNYRMITKESVAELSGRQSGKTELAFDVVLDRLEQGESVWGIKLSDEK